MFQLRKMSLTIIKAGLLDTVQDTGRYGYQHLGINPAGAMDRFSASLANALLGKELHAPVVELHFPAAQILFTQPAIICLAGADFSACVNNVRLPLYQPIAINKNSLLVFRQKQSGARCYLALAGQLRVAPWLNSCSTNLKAGAGGHQGRALKKGDDIAYDAIRFCTTQYPVCLPWRYAAPAGLTTRVDIITGAEWDWLTKESQAALLLKPFVLTPASDRMGYRLQGEKLQQQTMEQLVSSPVNFGTVQLLPNGQLLVLMADHQTTGGYPRVASIISAHLPGLAQMNAGDKINFAITTTEAAEEKLLAQQNLLRQLQNTCNLKLQNWLHAH